MGEDRLTPLPNLTLFLGKKAKKSIFLKKWSKEVG
jgi:hypothetical protein